MNAIPNRHIIGLRQENVSDKHYEATVIFAVCVLLVGVMFIGGCIASHPAHLKTEVVQ